MTASRSRRRCRATRAPRTRPRAGAWVRYSSPEPGGAETWNGHSIGRWEGDTLIVDTIGFNDKSWLFSDRHPHTEALRLTERIRLVGDREWLEIIATVDDPKALTRPYTYSRYSRRVTNEIRESVCNDDITAWRRMREEAQAGKQPVQRGAAGAPPDRATPPRPAPGGEKTFAGVYEAVPSGRLPTGLANNPESIEALPLLPAAEAVAKSRTPEQDTANTCQIVGPFRMMARPGIRFEVYTEPAKVVILFEDLAHGNKRVVYLNRGHQPNVEPSWLGDSVGKWDGDTLVIDTIGFNDRTWLNAAGAPHGEGLHLTERMRLVGDGQLLEVVVTATDATSLARPFTYTRYFQRTAVDAVEELVCQEAFPPPPVPTTIKRPK